MNRTRLACSVALTLAALGAPVALVGCGGTDSGLVSELNTEIDAAGALLMDELMPLFDTEEGRAALATIADQHDFLYFDGEARFAQTSNATSLATGGGVFSLEMIGRVPGGFARSVRFMGPVQPSGGTLVFGPSNVTLSITTPQGSTQTYDLPWEPSSLPPFGTINLSTGAIEIQDTQP